GPFPTWAAAPQAGEAAWRQGLQQPRTSPMVTRQGNPASAGTQGYRVQGAPRPPPVGHRTLHGLVHRLPPPDAALPTPRRHLHSLPRAGRRPRLLQTTPTNQLRQALSDRLRTALSAAGLGSAPWGTRRTGL